MQNEELYPEMIDYIFNYCGKYFWQKEINANRHLFALDKANKGVNVVMWKYFQDKKMDSTDQEVLDMVESGFEPFKLKVATRIWNVHKHELQLNLCPRCGKTARTPQAKQCMFCFHEWH
jgi:hypothetical protein